MIQIKLKDDSVKEYREGVTVLDVARDISQGLARVALAGEVNGTTVDIRKEINEDSSLNILTFDDEEGILAYFIPYYGSGCEAPVSGSQAGHRACH